MKKPTGKDEYTENADASLFTTSKSSIIFYHEDISNDNLKLNKGIKYTQRPIYIPKKLAKKKE